MINSRNNNYGISQIEMDISEYVENNLVGGNDTQDLVFKTQNINLVDTDDTKTTFVGELNTDSVTCSQTIFTHDQELVTKKYVDDVTGGSGFHVGTRDELLGLFQMSIGDQYYVSDYNPQKNKLYTYSGRCWGVIGETVELQAVSGLYPIVGNTVEISGSGSTSDFQFRLTDASEDIHVVGVVGWVGNDGWCAIATRGSWEVACHIGTYDCAHYLTCDSTDGIAHETTSVSAQPFAKILENKTVTSDGQLVWGLLHTAEIY